MEQLTSERLQDNLSRLKLTRAAEVLDTVADQAKENKGSYFAFLDHLLEEEVAAKEKRRIQTAMRTAGLPTAKTIEEYDFSFHPKLDQAEVMDDGKWLQEIQKAMDNLNNKESEITSGFVQSYYRQTD